MIYHYLISILNCIESINSQNIIYFEKNDFEIFTIPHPLYDVYQPLKAMKLGIFW